MSSGTDRIGERCGPGWRRPGAACRRSVSTSGPPTSKTRPAASGGLEDADAGSGRRRRRRSAGCGCATHRGVIMAGRWSTSWRVISQEMPPCPTMIPARRTVTGTPADAEQLLDLAAAAQVRRQVVAVVAEAAEVDDALQPGSRGRPAERRGRRGVLALEVRVAERVHEVVGGVAAGQRRAAGCRVGDVAVRPACRRRRRRPGCRVMAATSWPASARAGHSRPPTKPDAPATSTFTATARPARPRSPGRPRSAWPPPQLRSELWPRPGEGERGAPGQ